jgi:hypothetical protein
MAAVTFTTLIDKSPTFLSEYMSAMLPEKSVMVSSGAARIDDQLGAQLSAQGGKTLSRRLYDEDTTDEEVLAAATNLTVQALTTDADIVAVCARGRARGSEDLAAILAQADPLAEFAAQRTNYWARKFDTALIKVATGALGALGATVQYTDPASSPFAYEHVLGAVDLMGDNSEDLSIIICHSKIYHDMLRQNIVTFPNAGAVGQASVFLGGFIGNRKVVVSDQVYNTGGVYSTYIVAPGAFTLAFQKQVTVEAYREPLLAGGTEILVDTVHFVAHKNYVKWSGTAAGITPTNAELATTGNWTGVAGNDKMYRAVELQCKSTF